MLSYRCLLLIYLAQLCGWLALRFAAPCWHDHFRQGWFSHDRSVFYSDLTTYRKSERPVQHYGRFDYRQRQWERVSRRRALIEFPRGTDYVPQWEFRSIDEQHYMLQRFDTRTLETLEQRELQLPDDCKWELPHVFVHANRNLVSVNSDRIDYWDLTDPHSKMQSIAMDFKVSTRSIIVLSEIDGLLLESVDPVLRWPQPASLTLFRRTEAGQYELADSWTTNRPQLTVTWNDKIVTMPSGKKVFEVRSASTGQLLNSIDWPPSFAPTTPTYGFEIRDMGPIFTYSNLQGTQYFDVLRDRHLMIPTGSSLVGGLADGSLMVLRKPGSHIIWDERSQRVLRELPTDYQAHGEVQVLDQRTAVVVSYDHALSMEMIDLQTGQVLQRYRPFQWATWLLVGLMVLFPIWAVLWMRTSASLGWSPVIDLALIGLMPLLLAASFAQLADTSGVSWPHIPMPSSSCLLGIAMASLGMSVAWAMLSTGPIVARYLPWAVWEMIDISWLLMSREDPVSLLWSQHAPLPFLVAGLQMVRMSMRRLARGSPNESGAMSTRIGLVEYFGLTAAAAVVVGTSNYASTSLDQLRLLGWNVAGGLAMLSMICGTLSPNRALFGLSCIVASAGGLCLVGDAFSRWVLGIRLEHYMYGYPYSRIVGVTLVALFAACLALREHGYCLTKNFTDRS